MQAYDAWYDNEAGKAILAMDVKCVQPPQCACPRPYLEAGAGSGRFAQPPGTEYGVPGFAAIAAAPQDAK